MQHHIRKHWAHHLALWPTLIAILLLTTGGATAYHLYHRGGFRPGPLPPKIHATAGSALPAAYSLDQFVVRIHNQGASNSCVGQTLATLTEITNQEQTGHREPMSSGFIWNQINAGVDQGVTYQQAFDVLKTEGEATLAQFPPDGATDKFTQPSTKVITEAYAHHVTTWASVDPADTQTIKTELIAGRPLAIAIPVYSDLENTWNSPALPTFGQPTGTFAFWHSLTIIGYTTGGIIVLNSWGDQWGYHGRAVLSWAYIAGAGGEIVLSLPARTAPHTRPHTYHFPWTVWNAYRAAYKLTPIGVWKKHSLITPAATWTKNPWLGPIVTAPRYHAPGHYYTAQFVYGTITYWPEWNAARVDRT